MNQPKTYIENTSKEVVSVTQDPNSMLIDSKGFARNMIVKVESSNGVIFMTLEDFAKDYSVLEESSDQEKTEVDKNSSIVEEPLDSNTASSTEPSSAVE